MINYEQICQQVISLAKEAGNFIRQESELFTNAKIEYKGTNDMVSYVDKTAEEMIISGLSDLIPTAGFIAEENTKSMIAETYNWIIDPLDGTTNFIHGIPTYAVSIALKKNDELVIGVVYEIGRDECFYAWKGSKAYLNNKEIRVSASEKVSDSLIATGFPYYDFSRNELYIALFKDLIQNCHGLRRIGAASVDLVYTACGRFDAYFEYNLKPWDIAAGMLIVKQAGGDIFDFQGGANALKNCDIVATNGKISQELLSKINQYFNEK